MSERLPHMTSPLRFYCDSMRHLICVPYTVDNLHRMAEILGIKRCWYHRGASYPHYDIPKRRIAEIQAKCTVVSPRMILKIMKGESVPQAVEKDA